MRTLTLILISVSLISCSASRGDLSPAEGNHYINGIGLDPDFPDPLCTYRFQLGSYTRNEIYEFVDENLPPAGFEMEYGVRRIQFGDGAFVDIASKNWCESLAGDAIGGKLTELSLEEPEYIGVFEPISFADEADKYDPGPVDLESDSYRSSNCVTGISSIEFIETAAFYRLRFRYAIPIIHYQQTDTELLLLFGNSCERADYYASEIERLLS